MACGAGANMLYMANRHENIQFVGMDIEPKFIEYANQMLGKNSTYGNCKFYTGDWFDMEPKWIDAFDGIISFQTLLMFPDYMKAISNTQINLEIIIGRQTEKSIRTFIIIFIPQYAVKSL